MFMTDEEIYRMSGYKLGSYQAKWMGQMGIPHFMGRDGKPRVSRQAVEEMLAGKSTKRKSKPNFEALLNV